LAISSEPSTLDPALSVDVLSGSLISKVYCGLVRFNEKMEIVGDLAEKISVSNDGRVYHFRLRKGVKFSDGSEVIGRNFLESVKRVVGRDSLSQRKWVFRDIEGIDEFSNGETSEISGIRVVGDYEIDIKLKKPSGSFLSLMAIPNGYIVKEEGGKLFGTGPYILKEYRRGSFIKLARNPYYLGNDLKLEGIEYSIIKNNLSIWSAFSAGRLDIFNIPAELLSQFIKSEEVKKSYDLLSTPKLNIYYFCMNCGGEKFSNRDIRRAINYGIDKDEIIGSLLGGSVTKAEGPIPPPLRSWKMENPFDYNPKKAKEILKNYGYDENNPFKFVVNYKAKDEIGEIMSVIKAQLKRVNVEISMVPMEWSGLKAKVNSGNFDAAYLNWTADYPSPRNFFFPLFYSKNRGSAGNRSFYSSSEFDEMMEELDRLTDEVMISSIYGKMEKKVVDDCPWVPLWHETEYCLKQKWIKGYEIPKIYTQDRGLGIEKVK
jgi:ABC-type transport system substrate-binding protein